MAFTRPHSAAGRSFFSLRIGVMAILLLCSAGFAEVQYPGIQDSGTTPPLAFSTTGTITATQIGDGVWWTPELNETSVTQVLQDLNTWGVANLYLDCFRNGHTLYQSSVFPQRPDAVERDWLRYIITEAHSHNIRVHAWVQVLRWQDESTGDTSTHPLLLKHPQWLDVSAEGDATTEKSTALYVSPGVPEVRDSLNILAQEICRYPVDGLNIDAIEYNPLFESGYNAAVTREFRSLYEADPASLSRDSDEDSTWMKWVRFREDSLTSIVEIMGNEARVAGDAGHKKILVSATVQPGYEQDRGSNRRYQHWGQWLDQKLVDATMPQCFNPDLPELEQQLWQARSVHMDSTVACVPGLALTSEAGQPHPSLKEQKRLLQNAGFQHCTVLDYDALRKTMQAPPKEHDEKHSSFWSFLKKRY